MVLNLTTRVSNDCLRFQPRGKYGDQDVEAKLQITSRQYCWKSHTGQQYSLNSAYKWGKSTPYELDSGVELTQTLILIRYQSLSENCWATRYQAVIESLGAYSRCPIQGVRVSVGSRVLDICKMEQKNYRYNYHQYQQEGIMSKIILLKFTRDMQIRSTVPQPTRDPIQQLLPCRDHIYHISINKPLRITILKQAQKQNPK